MSKRKLRVLRHPHNSHVDYNLLARRVSPVAISIGGYKEIPDIWRHKVVGNGGSRLVIDLNDGTVMKVEKYSNYNTNSEVLRWYSASRNDRKWMLPILAHGTNWVVMPKVKLLRSCFEYNYEDDHEYTALVKETKTAVNFGDGHSGNFGWWRNRWVWLDYA